MPDMSAVLGWIRISVEVGTFPRLGTRALGDDRVVVHRTVVDAHVIMVRGGRVLLSRRRGSFGDGLWHLPSGKVDAGESLVQAAVREAWEEVGVRIDGNDLRHVHTLHATATGVEPRLGVFFEALAWHGEPENREPRSVTS